jgi:hypothetical protein
MRQEPIELPLTGRATRQRRAERISRSDDIGLIPEPSIVDEAFARFDGIHQTDSRTAISDGRIMKQTLVSDIAAQLDAIDRQRDRLARLLDEVNSIVD